MRPCVCKLPELWQRDKHVAFEAPVRDFFAALWLAVVEQNMAHNLQPN